MSNVFTAVGVVGKDAEVKYSAGGIAILAVNVAVTTGFGDKKKTMWVRVTVFGKKAEGKLVEFLKKGQQVFVAGELSLNEYQANDGTMKTSLELNANVLDLVGKKGDNGGQSQPAAAQPARQASPHERAKRNAYQPDDYDDGSDIPFN